MGKGICELGSWSLDPADTCMAALSWPKNELAEPPGGPVEVGEGRTSVSLEGASLRSLFQMPVPHEKEPEFGAWGRPRTLADAGWVPQAPTPASAEGVLGCDVVGDMELLAKEPLRGRGSGCEDVSLSHEDRRAGLWACDALDDWQASGRWSPSSSELARASESGVEVRALTFSRRGFWPLAGPGPSLDERPDLKDAALMIGTSKEDG